MEGVEKVLGGIVSQAEKNRSDSDYYVNGLRRCPVCGWEKERVVKIFGIDRVVPVMCQCDSLKYDIEQKRWDEEQKKIEIRRMKDRSFMDLKYKDAKFDDLSVNEYNREAYDMSRAYVDRFDEMYNDNRGLLFYGPVGTGKSYMAACIANALMENGVPVVMTSFVRLLEIFSRGREYESEVLRTMDESKLLVIDDLGAERSTDYALEKVYNVVDSRYRLRKPVIFTTNLGLKDISSENDIRYKRVYDRILEVCYPVRFAGSSWRIRKSLSMMDEMKNMLKEE